MKINLIFLIFHKLILYLPTSISLFTTCQNTPVLLSKKLIPFLVISFSNHINIRLEDTLKNSRTSKKDTAIMMVEEKLNKAVQMKAWSAAAEISLELSNLNFNKFRYNEAIFNNLQGLEFAKRSSDVNNEVANLLGLGTAYYAIFNYSLAMEQCLNALRLSAQIKDPELVMRINNRIGMIYKYLEDYDKAMDYFFPAYQEALRIKRGPFADLLMNIGNVEEALGNYNESIGYYQKYLQVRPSDPYTKVLAYNNMGNVYLKLKELDKASGLFWKAYQVEDTVANPPGRAYSYNDFAKVAQARGQYKEAIDYENKCLRLAEHFKIKNLKWECYDLLADCYRKTGDYQLANEALVQYIALKDSIFAHKRIDRINVLDAAYRFELETGKKQHEIMSLQKENDLRKLQLTNLLNKDRISGLRLANLNKERSLAQLQLNILLQKDSLFQLKLENYSKANMVTSMKIQALNQQNQMAGLQISLQRRSVLLMIIGTAMSLFAFIFYYRRYRLKKLLELEKIRSNIAADFHDELGSTLSSIALCSDMALWDKSVDINRIKLTLSQISESSRGTVSAMKDMIWTIHPKNDNMEEVIFHMREYAFPLAELKSINLTFHVQNGAEKIQPCMDIRKNLYLIFKEALNNAFKYSLASDISINVSQQYNVVKLIIKDNGVGFNLANTSRGNGLKNMEKRAHQNNGRLIITSFPGSGTEIIFSCFIS